MKSIIIAFFLFVLAWYAFPYVWKLAGGTFVNGREIIYNGNLITTVSEDCNFSTSKKNSNFTVEIFCGDNKTVWINGKIQSQKLTITDIKGFFSFYRHF